MTLKLTPTKEMRTINDEQAKQIADTCYDREYVLNFLRIIDATSDYAANIKFLMRQHQSNRINDDDMVKLCHSVRYCFGLIPNL